MQGNAIRIGGTGRKAFTISPLDTQAPIVSRAPTNITTVGMGSGLRVGRYSGECLPEAKAPPPLSEGVSTTPSPEVCQWVKDSVQTGGQLSASNYSICVGSMRSNRDIAWVNLCPPKSVERKPTATNVDDVGGQ